MRRLLRNVMFSLMWSVLLVIGGCGGDGGGFTEDSGTSGLIAGVGWYFDNAPAEMSDVGATCFANVQIGYRSSITAADIESWSVLAPDGAQWTVAGADSETGTFTSGIPFVATRLHYSANGHAFPLAGTWTISLKLKNGQTESVRGRLGEPGSALEATHPFLYTPEDWTPSSDAFQYVAALRRFPSSGYTAQYSAANGGAIGTTGFAAARSQYLATEPRGYNFYCWLFDESGNYLGHTGTAYSLTDHSTTALLTPQGELSIVPALVTSASVAAVDLSRVKQIRIVYTDGAQFTPSGTAQKRYRSISSLVQVN